MISALDNKWVKAAASLKSQKGRSETGLFLLEGHKLLTEAVSCGYEIEKIFITCGCEDKYPDFANRAEAVTEAVQKKICDSVTPQGISAIAKIKKIPFENYQMILVAENLQDPGNMGTLMRTAESFGFDGIVTVGSEISRFSPKVMRSAMGSALRMPVMHFDTPEAAAEFLSPKNITVYSAVLNSDSKKLNEVELSLPVAVAVGNEGRGLSEEFVNTFPSCVYIPMSGKTESLNAGAAAAVLMWEVYRKTL